MPASAMRAVTSMGLFDGFKKVRGGGGRARLSLSRARSRRAEAARGAGAGRGHGLKGWRARAHSRVRVLGRPCLNVAPATLHPPCPVCSR